MRDKISGFANNILESLTIYKSMIDNTDWKGSASNNFYDTFSSLINTLKEFVNNLFKLIDVLDLVEKIKNIDDEIVRLSNQIITLNDNMSDSVRTEAQTLNNGIYYSMNSKKRERNDLKDKAIEKLSSISSSSSSNLIDLSNIDIESAKVLFTYEEGKIYEFTTVDGKKYEAYIPNQVDPKAPLIVYDSGGNSSDTYNSSTDWSELKIYFEQHGFDHVMLRSLRRDNSYYYKDLCNKLNLKPENRLFVSFSGGFRPLFDEYYDLAVEEGSSPGVIAMMDGYVHGDKRYINQIIEDETVLLCFHQNWMNESGQSYFNTRNENLNMLIFTDQSEFGKSHAGIRRSLYDNNVIDYLTGKGELPDNYVISYYSPNSENADSRGFIHVDHSQVKTLDDVYNFFGIER